MSLPALSHRRCASRGPCASESQKPSLRISCAGNPDPGGVRAGAGGSLPPALSPSFLSLLPTSLVTAGGKSRSCPGCARGGVRPRRGVSEPGVRGDDPWGFCLPTAHRAQAAVAAADLRTRRIPGCRVPQLNVNRGNSGRQPSSPGPLPVPPPHVRWGSCLVRRWWPWPRPRQTVGDRAYGGLCSPCAQPWGGRTGSSPSPPPLLPFRTPHRDSFWGSH